MPLIQRLVEPVAVGRSYASSTSVSGNPWERRRQVTEVVASQEEACNRALANIIRQFGSLGLHANNIFGSYFNKLISKTKLFGINDPLGQVHGPVSSNHYFHLEIVFVCDM